MPTIPSEGSTPPAREPSRRPAPEPHRHREVAESFGTDAERYDRARPRYPRALIDRVLAVAPGTRVLDVGCGTGIVARQFAAAGCRVLGVDVDARMTGLARQYGLAAEDAAFEAWDPAGRTFDAIVSGQAWHWVDPVTGPAKAAQALRPDGVLAVFWNAGSPPPELATSFAEVYRRLLPDSLAARQWSVPAVDTYTAMCGKVADGIREAGGYGPPEQWRFDWEHTYTRDAWLDQIPTTGGHTRLSPAELAKVLAGIGAAIDAVGGGFTMRYSTLAVAARRKDAG
ncbi:class I SAM-dependent methyltransferase [Streptomyces rimosus]|uniref:class I SAM-dependent methyltransferase n=1 Tax=Streptomyces rimosus TaxID=1927 RepID=UPI0004C6D99D|nr:class I SAM-dependent methyltransferase [Streptomyces rimosus]